MAFGAVKAQNNPLINPQIREMNFVKHDSIRLYVKKLSGFFKYKIILAQDLFSAKQLFYNSGSYFTYDTIQKPIRIDAYYNNLKLILGTDTEAFSFYKKAKIFEHTSDIFLLTDLGFTIALIHRWTSNTPNTFQENRKSRMLYQASLGSLALCIASQYISRHYLNKSIKKFNQHAFAY